MLDNPRHRLLEWRRFFAVASVPTGLDWGFMMFMLCFSAFAGALIMAAFSIGTGSFAMLLAMPLAASACAFLAGAGLAVLGSREGTSGKDIGGMDIRGMDERELDMLADTLSQQLRSISAEPFPTSAPEGVVTEKRTA